MRELNKIKKMNAKRGTSSYMGDSEFKRVRPGHWEGGAQVIRVWSDLGHWLDQGFGSDLETNTVGGPIEIKGFKGWGYMGRHAPLSNGSHGYIYYPFQHTFGLDFSF